MYKIVRHYSNKNISRRTIERGLTLKEAQDHCRDPESHSDTCKKPHNKRRTKRLGPWFDGYAEDNGK